MADLDKILTKGLKRSRPEWAKLIGDRMTTVRERPAAWLPGGRIYRIDHMGVHHPVQFSVAVGTDNSVRVLTDAPDAFVAFAREQQVHLSDRDEAADYATALLETTRSTSKVVYVISDVGDIKFRPAVGPSEQDNRDQFVARFTGVIRPPAAEPADDGWEVDAYVVVDQKVQLDRIHVSPDGGFRARFEILADDLPLAVGR